MYILNPKTKKGNQMKLSVIIPAVLEYPLDVITVFNIAEELRDRVDFEIIYINNYCEEVKRQQVHRIINDFDLSIGNLTKEDKAKIKYLLKSDKTYGEIEELVYPMVKNDRSCDALKAVQRGYPWLKVLEYSDKLSHWQSKNLAIKQSTGDILCFVDAHCIISRDALYNMFKYYEANHKELNGSIHLPLTYHYHEFKQLVYKLVWDKEKSEIGYSFTGYRDTGQEVYEVPVMSTCGMMITKDMLVNDLGCWPVELGIYGGGENFMNFTMAVLGKKKWIKSGLPLKHHGADRGYHWNFDNKLRNVCMANYIFGGFNFAEDAMRNNRGSEEQKQKIFDSVVENKMINDHKDFILKNKKMSIEKWAEEESNKK